MGKLSRFRLIILTATLSTLLGMCAFVYVSAKRSENVGEEVDRLKAQVEKIAYTRGDLQKKRLEAEKAKALIRSELMRTKDAIEENTEQEKQYYENMKSRIKYLYETRNSTLLEILFSSKKMAEFLNWADFIQSVGEYDREMLEELSRIHRKLTAKQEALGVLTKEAEDLKNPYVPFSEGSTVKKAALAASTDDQVLLAAIIECEALPEYDSLLAVATVILNRVENPNFADSIRDVVYSEGQFHPVVIGTLEATLKRGPSSLSMQVSKDALEGRRLEAVQDCYYFLYAGASNRDGVNVGDNLFFQVW